uniref:Uncharacterized protein n=1 Tax=Oryza sativa subsp. japonica TaxID=39947 RepID=Q2QTA1_ORYSJ|nr:hypothetical protein LOC_Os12g20360 [Oryza sativa Japonica Group]
MAAGVGTAMTARAYHGVAGWRSSMARGAVWPKQGQPAVGDCRRFRFNALARPDYLFGRVAGEGGS